jgi:hypothetical protein
MRFRILKQLATVAVIVMLPGIASAQEATLSGLVTDSTGAVLPGVSITAVHDASGNAFETVSDERGEYRIPARTGSYRITAQLAGFQAVTRTGIELLIGQRAVVNLQLAPSSVQESVTVTGEAPLLDVTSSALGGNIDPRQMQELPLNGRNWMDLSVLAPGSRANAATDQPTPRNSLAEFQLNVDGQQVTNLVTSGFGQPRYSRDAIAEFELVSNRFDATQGRSIGVQVNAITKSGTNTPAGTFAGYFRDDRFNAADPVVNRVLPYSNQQLSATFGGPIRRDRLHYFVNYEYEREPQTFVYTTPYPRFNVDLSDSRRQHIGGAKMDLQFASQRRLSARYAKWNHVQPLRVAGGATTTPSTAEGGDRYSDQTFATLTDVYGARAVNEIRGGYASFRWCYYSPVRNPTSAALDCLGRGAGWGAPGIRLQGIRFGGGRFSPQEYNQESFSLRDDFTYSVAARGRHDLKLGGEYIYMKIFTYNCIGCIGQLDALGGRPPANLEDLFPDQFDVSTWNLAPISSVSRVWRQGVGTFDFTTPRNVYAAWVQDDWAIAQRLTLNLGVRYDLETNAFANDIELGPFLPGGRPDDTDNIAPRVGFTFRMNDLTVFRGGFGKYFGGRGNPHATETYARSAAPEALYDGRADFASNPFNGPVPTLQQVLAGGLRRDIELNIRNPEAQMPFSYQTSIGLQRQIGDVMAVTADYVYTGVRREESDINTNLTYDPVTGVNYRFTDLARRVFPDWGFVNMYMQDKRSNYHGLQTAVTKRFSDRWQASATYTLSTFKDSDVMPAYYQGFTRVEWPTVASDLGGEYGPAVNDQRHRAVLNGIWEIGYGFQVSGLYFYGSGERFVTTYGSDLRGTQDVRDRLRPNGTIVPRNNLRGEPLHRVDLRMQQRVGLGGTRSIQGMVEIFNLFNATNFGSYVTTEVSSSYGRPTQNLNVAYAPRTLQLGFRLAF